MGMSNTEPMIRPAPSGDGSVDAVDDYAFLDEATAKSRTETRKKEERRRAARAKKAVLIGQGDEPPPRPFLVEDWLPQGYATILFGHGGSGKSYWALLLALCVVTGRAFFGREVRRGPVLWIDAEDLGREEIERRAWQVARGFGLDRPPDGLLYYAPSKSVGDPAVAADVRAIVETHGVVLAVLDSLSAGAIGVDVSASQDTVKLMRGLNGWGTTVLALDHVSKRAASGETSASAFGSAFKHNLVRSSLGLSATKEDRDVIRLDHHKANFARKTEPVHYAVDFVGGDSDDFKPSVAFRLVDAPKRPAVGEKVSPVDLTLDALRELTGDPGRPVPVADLAEHRGLKSKTISNHLSELSARGLAVSHQGSWTIADPTPELPSLPGPLG